MTCIAKLGRQRCVVTSAEYDNPPLLLYIGWQIGSKVDKRQRVLTAHRQLMFTNHSDGSIYGFLAVDASMRTKHHPRP